ncbi:MULTISPECIES: DUF2768 domain-containing protein [Bacillales]|uniref:DUF2768 domain-containing protein n=1 Tax=Lysinibacillus louembei TaxID=1470088 RepID=A0ABZ0S2W3_9BACI|nr:MULTISPECIES: DUF2768 domain-containing protein [Bacillales]MCT6923146.1 DUF2768 domain-containing protein [Metasolibacillus sp.]MCT6939549.1 DUF2768 domain-containing protein [Metasolibacillus sp.]WPK11732.1 DUF2768 domain-containing protein [Lysinibacillus louembei]
MNNQILDSLLLNTARGPLAHIPALDVMWISFYAIGLLFFSVVIISATRKWVNNVFLSFIFKLIAYIMLATGAFLMVLIVATWPN